MQLTFLLLFMIVLGVMLMLWSGVAFIQNKKYFSTAPKDVQSIIKPRRERFRGAHAVGWLLAVIAIALIVGSVAIAVFDGLHRNFTFQQFFFRFLILLEGYKIWDMIFLDWYLLTKSRFFQHYYPEVETCESLKTFGFNLKSQLVKLLLVFPLLALALSYVCTLKR